MSFKNVLKVYGLLRELTDDEAALLATLRAMSDSERELLIESLGPPVKVKGKAVTKRNIEKCTACNYTRRAAVHRDTTLSGYHSFQEPQSSSKSKSARASSLAEKITGTASGNSKPSLCTFEIDGKVCKGTENDGIHDATMGYGNYHPFVLSSTVPPALGQSSTNDDEANSGTGLDAASSAAGG